MCNEYLSEVQEEEFLSLSHHTSKNVLSKTQVSIFVLVSLLITTCFLLKLIMEDVESNPGLSYGGAYGIK